MVTPRQWVSSFDQVVTQWMSTWTLVCGKAASSAQLHSPSILPPLLSVNPHDARSACGVGPADSTGKSLVRCWPGGTRSRGTSGPLRRRNPREIGGGALILGLRGSRTAGFEQEPGPPLGLVDPVLDQARARHVASLVAHVVGLAHACDHVLVVVAQFR